MQRDDDTIEDQHVRPALRPVPTAELPPGRQVMPRDWCNRDMPAGSTLLARHVTQQRRAHHRRIGRLKHNPDTTAQNEERRYAGWCWEMSVRGSDQEGLIDRHFGRSTAIH
jgi:hypothetical protein